MARSKQSSQEALVEAAYSARNQLLHLANSVFRARGYTGREDYEGQCRKVAERLKDTLYWLEQENEKATDETV